ncbi:MAG TPA: polysaccharide biosynthesis/export family protein [Lacibacter sp.]|nr:polysaccharide biosynthesis/export family protein [Lacibacter sp.]HMO88648.1 polysaccharide biosynthesis/export family protein [Lacibacter sp.]HMP85629.1 polysaccharide biosynthesis/export family protein [Lacibacter sp.]
MRYIVITSLLIFLLASCVTSEKLRKEIVYFNEGLDSSKLGQYQLVEPVIQKGDLLQISISSRSSSSNLLFSQNYAPSSTGTQQTGAVLQQSSPAALGYLVDITTGDVKLPLLGTIRADGMTKQQLEQEIIQRSAEYLREQPIVNIRYLNFRVTFLGSVGQPGTRIFDSERVSFLQALGEVGGIVPGGNLKEILLFREQNGKRTMHKIDLTNGDFFNSGNYYLKQNDVVYVSPTDRQLFASDVSAQRRLQYLNLAFGVANIIFILVNILR